MYCSSCSGFLLFEPLIALDVMSTPERWSYDEHQLTLSTVECLASLERWASSIDMNYDSETSVGTELNKEMMMVDVTVCMSKCHSVSA